MNYMNESLCVRVINLIKTQSENELLLHHINWKKKIKVVDTTNESNNDNDIIQLDLKRNTKEILENEKKRMMTIKLIQKLKSFLIQLTVRLIKIILIILIQTMYYF